MGSPKLEHAMSDAVRIIKKYPNRRLYDTVESRYITLADIRKLVLERIEFTVVDKKTQEDITRAILLQVISEQEQTPETLMSRDFLAQIIRSYGSNMQGVVGSYLEQSLKLFNSQQREIRDRVVRQVLHGPRIHGHRGVAGGHRNGSGLRGQPVQLGRFGLQAHRADHGQEGPEPHHRPL